MKDHPGPNCSGPTFPDPPAPGMARGPHVLIVGGGIAALYAALSLAPHPVLLVTPEPLGQGASSAWAQGGVRLWV